MASQYRHLRVLWSNGMQVSKDHFIQSDNATTDAVQFLGTKQLTPYNYGLLPSASPELNALALTVVSNKVELSACRAITPNGSPVLIPAYAGHIVERPLMAENVEQDQAVILKVDLYKQEKVVGTDDNMPGAIPQYSLDLRALIKGALPETQADELVLGIIRNNGLNGTKDAGYFPPCASIDSHPEVLDLYKRLVSRVEEGISSCFEIVQILADDRGHDSQLAENIALLVQGLIPPMSRLSDQFRLYLKHEAPVFTLAGITEVARALSNMLRARPKESNKEILLLNYLSDLGVIEIRDFRVALDTLLRYEYDHRNLAQAIEVMQAFVNILVINVLEKLSQIPEYKWATIKKGKMIIKHKQDHVE